jgi:hypothetical protein
MCPDSCVSFTSTDTPAICVSLSISINKRPTVKRLKADVLDTDTLPVSAFQLLKQPVCRDHGHVRFLDLSPSHWTVWNKFSSVTVQAMRAYGGDKTLLHCFSISSKCQSVWSISRRAKPPVHTEKGPLMAPKSVWNCMTGQLAGLVSLDSFNGWLFSRSVSQCVNQSVSQPRKYFSLTPPLNIRTRQSRNTGMTDNWT